MLVHAAAGSEEPLADVALVRLGAFQMNPSTDLCPAWLQHSVDSLHMQVQAARLGVAASTDLALVRSVLAVAVHVPLPYAGLAEQSWPGWALKGGRKGGRGRHPLLQLLPAARQPAAVVQQ